MFACPNHLPIRAFCIWNADLRVLQQHEHGNGRLLASGHCIVVPNSACQPFFVPFRPKSPYRARIANRSRAFSRSIFGFPMMGLTLQELMTCFFGVSSVPLSSW
jgi:hypothetical protein